MQANPVVYEGLVYFPTPGNHIVCLDGATGEKIWKVKCHKLYHIPGFKHQQRIK